jgi:cyclase
MPSELIIARMHLASQQAVADLFREFDATDLPALMETRRRQLFHYRGLYFHLQDFDDDHGSDTIEAAKTQPEFIKISQDLRPYISAYDPATWRSPKDAIATRFYHWAAKQRAR